MEFSFNKQILSKQQILIITKKILQLNSKTLLIVNIFILLNSQLIQQK